MSEPIKLQETWDEAVKIFEDIIGDGVDPEHQNGEYIKGKILGKSSKFSEKGKAVKTVNCVLALSAIAADAAAPICSPGPICLKGLAFLVDTAITFRQFYRVRSIRDVVEGLSVHLKDVEDTMNVHKLTPGGISQDLLDTCLQILRAFLDICTAYANVKKDSKKFTGTIKMVAKAGIKYDQGITDSLKTIEGLATRVGRLKENDVWKGNVENISSRVQSNNRNTISEVMCRHDKDIWKTWTTAAHNEHRERFTPQVGAWIETDEKLLTWAKLEERIATPTIILESPEGHGKSFICSEIIAQLASKDKPLSPKSKVSVAYFYFKPTGTSTQSKSEMKISLHEALMAVAWQLSQDDVSYQGFLADLCRNQQNHPTSAKDLWRNWIADYKPQNGSSKSIFIILDGIDQSAWKTGGDREALQDILHNINAYADNGLSIRLLLSCQESFHRNLGDRWKEVSVQIDLRIHLSKDVSAFIEQKMDYVCRHFDETDAKAWREKHESNLRSLRNCKLASLNTVFEAIGEESDSNKVSRIIGEALSNLRNYQLGIKKQVRKLNQNLDPAEIEDLNEMIACIVLMEQWPTLTQIQDILQLRAGNEVKKSTETLENQIKSYGRLLEVSDGVVSSADTMYYFQEHDTKQNPELPEDFDSALELDSSFRRLFRSPRDQQKDVIGNTESKRSTQEPTERPNQRANQESNQEQQMVGNNNRGKVDEKEVAIVERLLLATCGEDLYKRFGFDSFFDHLRNNTADSVQLTAHVQNNIAPKTLPSTSKIQFETHDGHLRIISFLLKSICLPDAKKLYKSLHNYASTYLFEHIKELDISEMEELQERVEKISRNLLSFFKNKKCVKIWLEPDMIEDVKFFDWAETSMKRTTEWFQTLDSKGYLYACLGEYTEPPTREELLSQPIEMLANQWLQREEWDVEFVFDRLLACYKLSGKLTKSKGPSDARDESDVESSDSDSSSDDSSSVTSDDSAIAPDLIYRVEGLARDELKLEEGNEVVDRTHNRVIETLLYYEHYSEVIERSKEIRENQKQNWHLML
ncbi:hypothetical protein DBV05_g11467 [Lasiodiplodia theobromae]|uniref:Nephrocystin 3-like N-terminal domain-containing protein n=1 Tax=Lasiodiplodia theobromae TaxID=45133 RepID=A0A5N5CX10_9PEZI|nr:hypothetical protein DBV05_g11467 [Lasiodiplodia theobromae]